MDSITRELVVELPAAESAGRLNISKVNTPHATRPEYINARPGDQSLPSKSQSAEKRETAAVARLRLKVAHCGSVGAKYPATTEVTASPAPSTPHIATGLFPESSSPSPISGRYAPRSDNSRETRDSSPSSMQL
ncbi:hypothetical protein K3495_g7738 [Podosphaera aphanis]|nr:hypothetical protein K3495_g7738 [Podosphaera aphanis]